MFVIKKIDKRPGRTPVAGAPEGVDALVVAGLAADHGEILHLARDDARMSRMAEALAFFAPEIDVVRVPAWDCLPYDRVSPNIDIESQRVTALSRLATGGPGRPRIVLSTVSAVLQRVPPRTMFRKASFSARVGAHLAIDELLAFLARNGFSRVGTVREPGEFAVRGGIIDLFPPGAEEPVRLDLFGDELEAVRRFDPLSQRTTGTEPGFSLCPVSEVLLDDESVSRFRTAYRDLFGAGATEDALYEAVSAKRRLPGVEHWLPLFHERLETLFDYVPEATVSLDFQLEESIEARLDLIVDYYQARLTVASGGGEEAGLRYRPVPPESLFLDRAEWDRRLAERAVVAFSPFAAPEPAGDAVDAGGRLGRDFADVRARPDVNVFDAVREAIDAHRAAGRRVLVAAYTPGSRERLASVMADHRIADLQPADDWAAARALPPRHAALVVLGLEHGFEIGDLAVVTEQDILGDRLARPPRRRRRAEAFLTELSSLEVGDLVVHVDHGIGRYDGLVTLEVAGAPHDCLRVVYEGGDKLFIPVENMEVLSRYGSEASEAQLDRLGGSGWQARKARVKARIRDMAEKLIRIAAERALRPGEILVPPEGAYDEFCARFPYPETEDQMAAIRDVIDDLASGKPMDRLICGDVGFGKTEVALRAAFIAAAGGAQVAVVVPTTLLARQHFKTFSERFAGLPVRIAQLSRLVGAKAAAEVRKGLADGSIDIVIGTHAVLGKSVSFRRLGLVIVDEEQHFGVAQKERLKELRADVHMLTLTATPIPRTLQLALSGVRDMSLIATPPVDRLAVRTFVLPYDPVIIREAITRELFRGGQVFYVCPRIEDLPKVAERLRALVPDAKVAIAHGRLAPSEIERVMSAFYDRACDILLSTNIIESGLDIPSVNTIVIHRADMFGLAQLYQLRGRVGRSKTRAYAYLTTPADRVLSATAQKRLEVMQMLDTLGAGFTLASHDMDIRGAGNLLGEEQSGHVREVGIELYQQMLEEAVAAAKEAKGAEAAAAAEQWTPQITIGTPVLIPETYVADLGVRLGLYRRIAALADRAEIDAFAVELVDRFGPLPPEVENLLEIVAIKLLCRRSGVEKVEAGPKGAVLSFRNNDFANPDRLIRWMSEQAGTVKLRPDHRLVYRRGWDDPPARVKGIRNLMQELADLAA
ncbi:MAG TPA: transcription-repair coupling factor [Alphaproteobacteria bacterium]